MHSDPIIYTKMSTNNPEGYLQEMSGSGMVEEGEETLAPNPTVRQEVTANPSPSLLKLKRQFLRYPMG